ncbi:MAG TPA: glycosyltransferase family 2 protein [Patescibacteria group bacterium]
MQKNFVTILIPCLNEKETIGNIVKQSKQLLKHEKIPGEVLVVDNNSTDTSGRLAKKAGARVVVCKKQGYGNAVRFGILQSKGAYIFLLDADESYKPSLLLQFKAALEKNNYPDLIIGSRIKGTIAPHAMPFLHKRIGTPFLTKLINILFSLSLSDCNSGIRLFNKEAFKKLSLTANGMEFASEMIIQAKLAKLSIIEIPVDFYPNKRILGKTHLRTIPDGFRHLANIVIHSIKK